VAAVHHEAAQDAIENYEAGQRAYYHRAKMNSAARTGTYAPAMEQEVSAV